MHNQAMHGTNIKLACSFLQMSSSLILFSKLPLWSSRLYQLSEILSVSLNLKIQTSTVVLRLLAVLITATNLTKYILGTSLVLHMSFPVLIVPVHPTKAYGGTQVYLQPLYGRRIRLPVLTARDAGWTPEPVWALRRRGKISCLCQEWKHDSSVV
jgi:hypothetical protein